MTAPLLAIEGLEKTFWLRQGNSDKVPLRAVQDVALRLQRGDSLGLVGESGCGKSTVARLVLRLLEPSAGRIMLDDEDLTRATGERLQRLRARVQIVFQDPHASLNPRRTIFQSVAEPLIIHRRLGRAALRRQVGALLETVGLPGRFMYRFPHELSGGQKQRVCIARAVALEPDLLILDEPTSALDVSVQAQILAFLEELRDRLGLTYLFISHNLAVVRLMCSRVAVMYLGRIIEEGPTDRLFEAPLHPYTRALIDAVPLPAATQPLGQRLAGEVPSPVDLPPGCPFHRRCPARIDGLCDQHVPAWRQLDGERRVACHLHDPSREVEPVG